MTKALSWMAIFGIWLGLIVFFIVQQNSVGGPSTFLAKHRYCFNFVWNNYNYRLLSRCYSEKSKLQMSLSKRELPSVTGKKEIIALYQKFWQQHRDNRSREIFVAANRNLTIEVFLLVPGKNQPQSESLLMARQVKWNEDFTIRKETLFLSANNGWQLPKRWPQYRLTSKVSDKNIFHDSLWRASNIRSAVTQEGMVIDNLDENKKWQFRFSDAKN